MRTRLARPWLRVSVGLARVMYLCEILFSEIVATVMQDRFAEDVLFRVLIAFR